MAKRVGARTIGTAGNEEKAKLARKAGAEEVIVYTKQDFEAEVRKLTGGAGASVVYDSVGKDTFDRSLKCLRRRGMLVLFGQSSGAVPPFDLQRLSAGGSLYITRPTLASYTTTRDELLARAGAVLDMVRKGELDVKIDAEIPLALRLALGRLHHERTDHRERRGGRVEAVVHQPLRHVLHLDAGVALHLAQIEDALVRDGAVLPDVEDREVRREALGDVVRVEDGDACRVCEPFRSHQLDVRPRDEKDRRAPPRRGGDRADRLLSADAHDGMTWQVRREMLRDADGPHPGPAAAVRDAERLVQVQVADVGTEIARPAQ